MFFFQYFMEAKDEGIIVNRFGQTTNHFEACPEIFLYRRTFVGKQPGCKTRGAFCPHIGFADVTMAIFLCNEAKHFGVDPNEYDSCSLWE